MNRKRHSDLSTSPAQTGVSALAANELRAAGTIDYRRATVTIRSRSELEKESCSCYPALTNDYASFLQGTGLMEMGSWFERWEDMVCYTCGCKLPYEDHGDPANIIEDHLKAAGQTETIKKAGVKAAKQNLLELIEIQKNRGDLENPKKDYNK
jgi:hypothetical protein